MVTKPIGYKTLSSSRQELCYVQYVCNDDHD